MEGLHMNIIDRFCTGFERSDSDAFTDMFTEDAMYIDSVYGLCSGRDAIKALHKRCHEEGEKYRFTPILYLFNNHTDAAFEWKFEFISLMPASKGKRITAEGGSFLSLRDNRITSYREYMDSIAILLKGNVPDDRIMKFYYRKYP
jgi:ketosteroid isomerase-like protein